ncbi:major facilitator superfamily domain-containing protein [Phlebopus sp. FC_14]|nr:major facilitator superfamily domain-containing protein [Phlebopus sp. FC_14]
MRSVSPNQERKLWRKIDLRLLPFMSLMQLLSFMDRGNAKLDGLMTQLNLTGSNLIIQVIRPSRWLPGIMILWGIVMTLMGFVKSYPQLVAVRFCLGVAEAGLVPGVVYYLTMWYPKYMYQYRIALFSGTATLAGAFSGLLAFAISFMNGDGSLQGWSWIFILEGIITVVAGLIGTLVMVDYPTTAHFLTSQERTFVLQRQEDDAAIDENDHLIQQVWAAFTDWQFAVYGITYFLPFGYNTSTSQLLTVPPYACAFITLLVFAYLSDKHKIRSPFIFTLQLIALMGYIINISNTSSGVKYFGTYLCVVGSYSAPPGSMSWLANNLQGKYKRAVGLALQMTMGNFGGAIACNIFRTQDEPHALEIMFLSMGLIGIPITALCYRWVNIQKNGKKSKRADETAGKSGFLGDKVSTFKYTL